MLSFHRQPLRHRLQLAAFGVPTLVVTLFAGMWIAGNNPFPHLFGDDLVPSYMAGTFVREGRANQLMDFPATARFQRDLRRSADLEQHGRTGPWLNPPFFALLFVPLSLLKYRAALWTWFGINCALLAASGWLLYRMLPAHRRRPADAAILAGLLVFSMPSLQAMACQQNTFLSLLILCSAVTLWRSDRFFAAGVVAGLLAFKPQLALLVWAAMAVMCGRRAIAGIIATGGVLGLITLIVLPGSLQDYVAHLSAAVPYNSAIRPYAWERQVTLQAFVRLLVPTSVADPQAALVKAAWLTMAALLALPMARTIWRASKQSPLTPARRDGAISLAITAMPLLMPYYMDYDLLLLAVPAVLLAGKRMADATVDRRQVWAWLAFFACLYFNAAIADSTRISVTILLLLALCVQQMLGLRACRIAQPELTASADRLLLRPAA